MHFPMDYLLFDSDWIHLWFSSADCNARWPEDFEVETWHRRCTSRSIAAIAAIAELGRNGLAVGAVIKEL